MAVPNEIKKYLARNRVPYVHKTHPVAFTAQEIAAAEHVTGREIAKTVVLDADGQLILAVLPADHVIDMDVLKSKVGCERLSLASEARFEGRFEACRTGAMPPLGRFFGLPMFCDRLLAEKSEIEFNAGTHIDTIRMPFSEFASLERPVLTDFAERPAGKWRPRVA